MVRLMRWLRPRLTYANVIATLALFIALGGNSYAALKVSGRQIVNNSVGSVDVRNNDVRSKDIRNRTLRGNDVALNALGGGAIAEFKLRQVPDSLRLGGKFAADYRLRCPSETNARAGVCLEATPRPQTTFGGAYNSCSDAGRRLPDYTLLEEFAGEGGNIGAPSEWTSSVYEGDPGQLKVILVTDASGAEFQPASTPLQRPFRCMALPTN